MDKRSLLIRNLSFFVGLNFILGLIACSQSENLSPTSNWLPSQVRTLDPVESAPNPISRIAPSQDLIALYTRETEDQLQIRLDFLDLVLFSTKGLPITPNFDLYLELWPAQWDNANPHLRIQIPADGTPTAHFQNNSGPTSLTPRVIFDTAIDAVTINLDRQNLPELQNGFAIRAFITNPGSFAILDEIPTVNSTAQVEPIPMLMAFWNTLPAHTYAQAIRRWDGAHTGPFGKRHGLKHLLDASQANLVPITLLDLKTPSSLSALDALGQTGRIKVMRAEGLLILPDTLPESNFGGLPDWMVDKAADTSWQTGLTFDLPQSKLIYSPFYSNYFSDDYLLAFMRDSSNSELLLPLTQINRLNEISFVQVPLSGNKNIQATAQGLPIKLRSDLIQLGLDSKSPTPIVFLGGNLPYSTWGDPRSAMATLKYIALHPWLQVLAESDLKNLSNCNDCPPTESSLSPDIDHPVIQALQNAPDNYISDLAWHMFLDLSGPEASYDPEKLSELRANYLGEIGNLLAAADWEHHYINTKSTSTIRKTISVDCTQDTDFDGQPECILANENYFVLLDPQGARLSGLLARIPGGVTQLVGGSSQFIVGLSDPNEWDLTAGPLSDPAILPGAFAGPWVDYQVEILEDSIRFTTNGVEKIYQLTQAGFQVEIHSDQPQTYQIPLVVAPETRFTPGWIEQYQETVTPQGLTWGIKKGPKVEVLTEENISSQNFQISNIRLREGDDPNLGFSPGQFVPFPLSIIHIPSTNGLWLEIKVRE